MSSSALIFSEMKRLLSILVSVDGRMVFQDLCVNDILSNIVAKRITGRVCNDRLCFHGTDVSASCKFSQKRVYSHVRNSSTVHKQENIVWTQVEKGINSGVFNLRTVDLTVWKGRRYIAIVADTA